ncbi:MAG: U32 family peptidase [Lachnospiraceae bacterium]|nr:U32 family peptidase [Lachnospiraceae bacterium]
MEISVVCERDDVKKAVRRSFPGIHVYETVLPYVFRTGNTDIMEEALESDEAVARTVDELAFLTENSYMGRIIGDTYLYAMNSRAADMLKEMGLCRDCAPLELTFNELRERGVSESELMVYGRVPLMVSAQCVYRNTHDDRCGKDEKNGHWVTLKDRTGRDLPCRCDCRCCCNIIYNSVPLSLHNMMKEVTKLDPASLRLVFTTEGPEEACSIAGYYTELVNEGKNDRPFPVKEYTTGHFRNKVE